MEKENEQVTPTEEETIPSNLESQESSDDDRGSYEDPDFAAITSFVEDGSEVAPVEETDEVATLEQAEPALEEPTTEVEESESVDLKQEEEKPEVPEKVEEKPVEEAVVKLPTKEELQGLYTEHRAKMLPELEKAFTLSDEEAAALDEQPSKVLPKLAAQLQYDVMLSTYNAVIAALPSVVGTYQKATTIAQKAEDKFMSAWPDLNKPEAVPVIKSAIAAYKSANPKATQDQIIQNAGVMAMINMGLDPMKAKQAQQTAQAPKPRTLPPKPAAPSGSVPTPPRPKTADEGNVFSEIAEVFSKEFG